MQVSAASSGSVALPAAVPSEAFGRSLEGLIETNFAGVWRALRRAGLSPADADDAAQQVCLVLARRLPEITPGRERAFMFGAAFKIASRLRRSELRRREALDADYDSLESTSPGPEVAIDQRRAAALLDRVLDGLEEELRQVFVLHEIEQLTMQEIALALELPNGTVASRLRRAREKFNRRLSALRAAKRVEMDEP
jgi:RNA polymerase sigma-70 factor (ECF subfamily)